MGHAIARRWTKSETIITWGLRDLVSAQASRWFDGWNPQFGLKMCWDSTKTSLRLLLCRRSTNSIEYPLLEITSLRMHNCTFAVLRYLAYVARRRDHVASSLLPEFDICVLTHIWRRPGRTRQLPLPISLGKHGYLFCSF